MMDKYIESTESRKKASDGREAMLFGLKDPEKIESFEKMLSEELLLSDTIREGFEKLTRCALAAEFGMEILSKKVTENMVGTIVNGLLSDSELRKQALLIIDRYARQQELNA